MTWHLAGNIRDVNEGNMKCFRVQGKEIVIAKVHGELFAFDDTCTHAEVSLASGMLEGHIVECCAHGARFDIRTGAVASLPATEGITTYPVKREGDEAYVDLRS